MISPELLHLVSLTVAKTLGWDLMQSRSADLKRGLMATAREFGVDENPGALEIWLKQVAWNSKELEILTSHLTVGETYFFRDKEVLEVFRNQIVPEILRERSGKNQYIRIWSAGCCTGEEPYTLAMLLRESITDFNNWIVSILGTDINPDFLKKAQKGVYTNWSFRETSVSMKNRFFSRKGNVWHLDPEIMRMVKFAMLNLADGNYPSAVTHTQGLDVIFCRNVLMYFTPEQIRMVGKRFYQSLSPNGWLVTTAVELNDDYFEDFNPVRINDCTVYRKMPKPIRKHPVHGLSLPMKANAAAPPIAKHPGPKSLDQPAAMPIARHPGIKSLDKHAAMPIKRFVDPPKKEIPGMDQQAKQLFSQGHYQRCIEICESALIKKPDDFIMLELLVRSTANLGLVQDARHWAESMIKHGAVTSEHYYLYAHILMEADEISLAELNLKRALYLNPHHLMSHYLMGNIAKKMNQQRVASKHFQNVRELLDNFEEEELVPGADGITAGRLKKMLNNFT